MELKNRRHETFCLEYIRQGNVTKAYMAAFPNSKRTSASSNGSKLLNNPKVKLRLTELAAEVKTSAIADAKEIQERLTSILRGEVQEEVVVVEGIEKGVTEARVIHKLPSNTDAIKAAQTLCRIQGAYDQNVNLTVAVPQIMGDQDV